MIVRIWLLSLQINQAQDRTKESVPPDPGDKVEDEEPGHQANPGGHKGAAEDQA